MKKSATISEIWNFSWRIIFYRRALLMFSYLFLLLAFIVIVIRLLKSVEVRI